MSQIPFSLKKLNQKLDRRDFVKLSGLGLSSLYFSGCTSLAASQDPFVNPFDYSDFSLISPFDRTIPNSAPKHFSGDQPLKAHKVLWQKSEFLRLNPFPPPSEEVPVVVVGGGMSGLLSAYFLKEHQPVILEQAARFGGNSRGESWEGLDYTLATAYIGVPAVGSPIHKFFQEIGMADSFRIKSSADPMYFNNKKITNVWETGTNTKNKPQFTRLASHFENVFKGEAGLKYPEMPTNDPVERNYLNELDKISFRQYVENVLGETIDPDLDKVLENYFWSTFASSHVETSAAVGLNFFSSDFDAMAIAKGGNAAIAEATMKTMSKSIPRNNFRNSSFVFDVRRVGKKIHVSYLDSQDKIKTISAKTVVMSCPKFVASKLIDNLEPERLAIIRKIQYRSYLLANVLINRQIQDTFYDFADISKNAPVKKGVQHQKITDAIHGSYLQPKEPRAVLTFFQGIPYDNVRNEIYDRNYYQLAHEAMKSQINEFLPKMGINSQEVVDIRLTRWGHPLPLPSVGNIANGNVDILRQPFQERVFFVEQDNWTMPCFESTFFEAHHFSKKISDLIS
ncbi:MAG: NAD(P)-binding protein [Bdellovibrionota bacterium]